MPGPPGNLRNTSSSGGANGGTFTFGQEGDVPVMADYSNSGVRTVGMVRNTRHGVAGSQNSLVWYLRQVEGPGDPELVVEYGKPGDIPVIGDWNGNGVHTVGVVRGNRWLLKNSNQSGSADHDFKFGEPGDIPVVGDARRCETLQRAEESITNPWLTHRLEPAADAVFRRLNNLPYCSTWSGT